MERRSALVDFLPFFRVALWVFYMPSVRQKIITVGDILGFDIICLAVFAGILSWI